MSEKKTALKTVICGEIQMVEMIPYGQDKEFCSVTVVTTVPKYDGSTEEMVCKLISFFNKIIEKLKVLRAGDYCAFGCTAQSRANRSGYLNWSMMVDSIESQSNVVPPETVAQDIQEEASKQMDGDASLPF
jgi:hypothetical protein